MLSCEFVDFPLPTQMSKAKLENVALVEPFYIYSLLSDASGEERFLRYNLLDGSITNMQLPTVSHDNFKL